MRHLKLISFVLALCALCITGCLKSEGWQCKEAYNKVIAMYENNEIKEKMYSKLFDNDKENAWVEIQFGEDNWDKYAQSYNMKIIKKQGESREAREKYEKEIKEWEHWYKALGNDVFTKGNIIVSVPKATHPKLEKKVYDLFMSYVK